MIRPSVPSRTQTYDGSVITTQRRRYLPTPLRLVVGLALMVLAGTLLLMLPGVAQGGQLSWIEALFTATSALSVTGLSIITPVEDLTLFGEILLLLLIQMGGVGFMVLAVVVFRLIGRRVSLLDRQALCNSLGLVMPEAILSLAQKVLLSVLLLEGLGAIPLWIHWRDDLGPGQAGLYALFHSISAFCNAGFDLFPEGIPTDNLSLVLLGLLIVVGGLGIPVVGGLLNWPQERRLSLHVRVTLITITILLLVGGVGMFFAESSVGGVIAAEPWPRRLLLTFFHSISARTAGFAAVPIGEFSEASQLLIMGLMFIGASPASMGGGITTGTFAVLVFTLWGYARGLSTPQIGGRRLAPDMVRKASAVLTISLFVVMLAAWMILMTHEAELDQVLFEVISAFATCGLSQNFTGELNLLGRLVIIAVMFWGRLGALTIILALAQQRPRQLVVYPEEPILIG